MNQPLVSIIIRTCQRPYVLEQALLSVQSQTYKNIEIVVIEDGSNVSEQFIYDNFSGLDIQYVATMRKRGRSYAGNVGLNIAKGDFVNFLDDDDMLFSNHVQTLVDVLLQTKMLAAYSVAEERQIQVYAKNPYKHKIKHKTIRYRQSFNRNLLYTFNYIPIQSIMFRRTLFEQLGGFDEKLENLEDWDLWVRYSTITDFMFVNQITSCYHVPVKNKDKRIRSVEMREHLALVLQNFESYNVNMNVKKINDEMNYVIREYKNNGIMRYMRMFFRAIFFGEK